MLVTMQKTVPPGRKFCGSLLCRTLKHCGTWNYIRREAPENFFKFVCILCDWFDKTKWLMGTILWRFMTRGGGEGSKIKKKFMTLYDRGGGGLKNSNFGKKFYDVIKQWNLTKTTFNFGGGRFFLPKFTSKKICGQILFDPPPPLPKLNVVLVSINLNVYSREIVSPTAAKIIGHGFIFSPRSFFLRLEKISD